MARRVSWCCCRRRPTTAFRDSASSAHAAHPRPPTPTQPPPPPLPSPPGSHFVAHFAPRLLEVLTTQRGEFYFRALLPGLHTRPVPELSAEDDDGAASSLGEDALVVARSVQTCAYDRIGEVRFIELDVPHAGWCVEAVAGLELFEELEPLTDDVERGNWSYHVLDPSGLVPLSAAEPNAPPGEQRLIPYRQRVTVVERRIRARDWMTMSAPPVYLQLAYEGGWLVEAPGSCEKCVERTVLGCDYCSYYVRTAATTTTLTPARPGTPAAR